MQCQQAYLIAVRIPPGQGHKAEASELFGGDTSRGWALGKGLGVASGYKL